MPNRFNSNNSSTKKKAHDSPADKDCSRKRRYYLKRSKSFSKARCRISTQMEIKKCIELEGKKLENKEDKLSMFTGQEKAVVEYLATIDEYPLNCEEPTTVN